MKVLVAMSGGVDSAVAALLLADAGHDVTGVTMRLWGGESDTGCCSVSDVDDARRCAQQIGIDHLVFNFSDDFERDVVGPYVEAHRTGTTPNPCIECNRHLEFDRLLERATTLGFDAVATGHHARIVPDGAGLPRVARGADADKDQSYVVHMLGGEALRRTVFHVGEMSKAQVREVARRHGLRTASKPDSQDVCFIGSTTGRSGFLRDRIDFTPATVVDLDGREVAAVEAVQLVTIGQRRGLGLGGGEKRYVLDVDVERARVTVGDEDDLLVDETLVDSAHWPHAGDRPTAPVRVLVQASAHGAVQPALVSETTESEGVRVQWENPARRVAPGQSLVFYDPGNLFVVGGGTVRR